MAVASATFVMAMMGVVLTDVELVVVLVLLLSQP